MANNKSSVLGGVFSAGAGLLSGVFSGIGANKRLKQTLAAQREESRLARQFQEKMYSRSVDDARSNVRDERLYNLPSAQRQRLRDAGLNADLIYGGGASGLVDSNVASSGSVPSTNVPDVGSSIMSTPTMGESILRGISAMRELAEARNINVDTSKKQGEVTSIDLDNIVKAATTGSRIELQDMQVSLSKSVLSLNDAQKSKLNQELQNLQSANELCNKQIDKVIAETHNLDVTTLRNRLELYFAGPRFEMEVRNFQQSLRESDARINLSSAQAQDILMMMTAKKLNVEVDTLLKNEQRMKAIQDTWNSYFEGENLQIQGKQLQFDYEQSQTFDSWQRFAIIANLGLSSVSDILGAVTKVGALTKTLPKIKDFGR